MLQFVVDQPQQPIQPPDPDEDESATDLASKLHATERQASSVIEGVYRPLRLPGLHDALGVAVDAHEDRGCGQISSRSECIWGSSGASAVGAHGG